MVQVCRLDLLSVCLSVCLLVRKVYCGKTAERIRMPFGVVSGVSWGMGVLDGGGYHRREWVSFWMNVRVNVRLPIVNSGAFVV